MVVEETGFVDDAREFFDDSFAVEFAGFGDADEGEVGALEEFFHVLGVAAEGMVGVFAFVEFDGANGAQSALIAEDKVDGFVFDEAIGLIAVLAADFVVEQGREADLGNNIESLSKNVVKQLETLAFGANHEVLLGAITAVRHCFGAALAGVDAGQN